MAAVGVLSLRSGVKTAPLTSPLRVKEFRFDPTAELTPSESSSSSSSDRSSLLVADSEGIRVVLADCCPALVLDLWI